MTKRFNLILSILAGSFIFAGCASKKLREGAVDRAQWETKALIKDFKSNKTQTLTIDILAIREERARFEISALLGFHVGSMVMDNDDISYVIYPRKTFYTGRASEAAFARMLDLPLHPMNLANIAFEDPVRGPGWSCKKNLTGLLSACENSGRRLSVEWLQRDKGAKKVLIKGPQFEMQWHFAAPQTEVQFKTETFTLLQPKGFKAEQIN